jgi:redox-sensitive bicupin YhaK (pirin superfamily)
MRKVKKVMRAKGTMEGAGVRLHRGFSYDETNLFDPFLLFDDFSSLDSEDYLAGFPWHPHRGIETVSYIIKGSIKHRDSIGSSGIITDGAVQWMTAGKGIIHEEMPASTDGIKGFQLWVNLPAEHKLMPPRYQEIMGKDIPEVALGNNATARIIAGSIDGTNGPAKDIMASPSYIDITLKPHKSLSVPVVDGHTAFIYVFDGSLTPDGHSESVGERNIILFDRDGTELTVHASASGARFLVVSGRPLHEPIAWHGPIVMNTEDELVTAMEDLRTGTFL